MRIIAGLIVGLAVTNAFAQEMNETRAYFNYQMHCQGCHTPDGTGARTVPRIKDNIGTFLTTQAGREYLVRVPGSATSALNNANLAEVLNWMVLEFSGDSAPDTFMQYTEKEVAALRREPLLEVALYRARLIRDIAAANAQE